VYRTLHSLQARIYNRACHTLEQFRFRSFNITIANMHNANAETVKDASEMIEVQVEAEVVYDIDPIEEKQVLRKLDRVILPLMALVYFMQHLDKQSINYASVFGLRDDTHLTGVEFSWAVSLFYFGQLVCEYPAIYLMSRLPIVPFVGTTM
jgi:hypothetical protein